MKRYCVIALLSFALAAFSGSAFGQACVASSTQSCTPNIQLATPFLNAPNWNVALNQNFTLLDQLLSGNANLSQLRFLNGTISGNVVFGGNLTVNNLDNIVYVDGSKYAQTPVGIQAAINQAQTNVCGSVFIPPAVIAMGGTQITIPSCVKVSGAGMKQTILQWTSTLVSGAIGMTSPVGSYVGNLELSFNSGNTSDAIRITGSDASPAFDNTFENILIDFSTLGGSGSSGIHATSSGPSFTDVVLNTFRNIIVQTADQAVVCQGCEGNYWQIASQNTGAHAGAVMFNELTPEADEIIDARMESGSGNFANEICLQIAGSNNLVRLTCDGNLVGTAVNDTGGWNIFDVDTVGTPTLGTISANSQYRYVNSANGGNVLGVGQLKVQTVLLSNTAPAIASGFGTSPSIVNSNGTAVFTLNVGTGGTATSGVLTMPAASVGWSCQVSDLNTNIVTRETAYTTNSVTLTAASAWTASDKLLINCGAF